MKIGDKVKASKLLLEKYGRFNRQLPEGKVATIIDVFVDTDDSTWYNVRWGKTDVNRNNYEIEDLILVTFEHYLTEAEKL